MEAEVVVRARKFRKRLVHSSHKFTLLYAPIALGATQHKFGQVFIYPI